MKRTIDVESLRFRTEYPTDEEFAAIRAVLDNPYSLGAAIKQIMLRLEDGQVTIEDLLHVEPIKLHELAVLTSRALASAVHTEDIFRNIVEQIDE